MSSPLVLSAGQCAMDHATISRYLQREFHAKVVAASDRQETERELGSHKFDLILVNRILDGDGALGMDLLRDWKDDPEYAGPPVMLVSNYSDAQKQAVALGALPGFGKATLASPETREKLAAILERNG